MSCRNPIGWQHNRQNLLWQSCYLARACAREKTDECDGDRARGFRRRSRRRRRPAGDRRLAVVAGIGIAARRPGPGALHPRNARTKGHGDRPRRRGAPLFALPQHHFPRKAAALSRRSADGGAHHHDHAVECAGHGHARQQGAWRTRRPCRELCVGCRDIRNRLQPLLSCRRRRRWRRPRLFPAAFGPRCLFSCFSGRPVDRGSDHALPGRS